MLKIIDTLPCTDVSVEMDEYVPFTVEFASGGLSPPIYWRGGDGRFSLLEIGLGEKSGAIRSIALTIISADSVVNSEEEVSPDSSLAIEGLPVFDTSGWPKLGGGPFLTVF